MAPATRSRWILAIILIAGIFVAWWMRRRPVQYSLAYVGERTVTVWSTTAQVRQTVATLPYGEQVLVVHQAGDQTEVRTAGGALGWVDSRLLISAEMWRKLLDLASAAQAMPVQAVGHTRALSNVHAAPSRDAQRIFQFGANVPLAVLDRRSVPIPGTIAESQPPQAPPAQSRKADSARSQLPQEDWLLVLRTQAPGTGVTSVAGAEPVAAVTPATASPPPGGVSAADFRVAGWILARFVELDPPPPIPDYASAEALHVVAWAVLDSVPDPSDPSGAKPQYVVAGIHGAETPGCEFNAFRVFTWDAKRGHYETAYVASDVCGSLPIVVQQTSAGPDFHFADPSQADTPRFYELRQTVVRPLRQGGAGAGARHSAARGKRL